MIAIIKEASQQYVSPVLALSNDKRWFDKSIIVIDKTYSYLRKVELYRKERLQNSNGYQLFLQSFIIDYDETLFENRNWNGIASLVRNNIIMDKLLKGEKIPLNEAPQLIQYAKKIILPEWFEVKASQDAENLLEVACGFHDATLEKAIQGDNFLQLELNFINGLITIRFEDIFENEIMDKVGLILNSTITVEKDGSRWEILDGYSGWDDGVDFDNNATGSFIKSKKLFWKIKIK